MVQNAKISLPYNFKVYEPVTDKFINNKELQLDDNITWETIKEYENYSGDGSYIYNFTSEYKKSILSIEHLYCTAEVYLNDKFVDVIWFNNEILLEDINIGNNKLEIIVTSTLFNASLKYDTQYDANVLSKNWPHFGQIINNNRKDKKRYVA